MEHTRNDEYEYYAELGEFIVEQSPYPAGYPIGRLAESDRAGVAMNRSRVSPVPRAIPVGMPFTINADTYNIIKMIVMEYSPQPAGRRKHVIIMYAGDGI